MYCSKSYKFIKNNKPKNHLTYQLMHKKLEADLVSLAHSILQMKNKDDLTALHKKAQEIQEKLAVLKFVDTYFETGSNLSDSKEEIIHKIEEVFPDEVKEETSTGPELKATKKEMLIEEQLEKDNELTKDEETETSSIQISLEEEFKDAISADVATQLFEKATKENPVVETQTESKQKSLNDALFTNNIQVGLNDRIAFVKHLFDGSQEDFNRVISQLNSFKTEKEAKKFINKLVKPDYDWRNKEDFEERLINLIERKFL
jgi:hypothetical protein